MSEQNVMEVPAHNAASDDFEGGSFEGADFEGGNEENTGGGPIPPGMGQSKSSRRRRRKRKNKAVGASPEGSPAPAGEEGAQPAFAAPVVMEGESLALAASAAPAPQARKPMPNGQGAPNAGQGQQQQGAGGKRWKKKFRDRDRRPGRSDSPGNDVRADGASNSFSNPGAGFSNGYRQDGRPDNFGNLNGFKRKGKSSQQQGGRKDRSFVGPMDHSYRETNGNFADSPPSTIQVHSNGGRRGGHRHHGDSQPLDFSQPRAIPIAEDAQTHIYFFIEDLFLTAKIQETARKQGIKVAFIKNEKEAIAELTSGENTDKPALIVFDLNNTMAKPLTLIPKLRTKLKRSSSIIGFLSSIQGDLKAKAMEAGCDTVMPRAAFSQNLPNLLRRYGVETEDDVNYNY